MKQISMENYHEANRVVSLGQAGERFVEARNCVRTHIKSWRVGRRTIRRVEKAQSDANVANS